jgi:hypothetical protein
MRTALAAEPVLCGDETPVNVIGRDTLLRALLHT